MRSFLAATSERSADSSCRQWHSQLPPSAAVISKACEDAAAVSKAYQDEVNQRRRAAMERAAAAEQDTAALARRSAFKLDVREASGLGVAECRAEYVAQYRPLVITGLESMTDPAPWTLPWLEEHCAAKRVAVNLGGSQTMASCSVAGVEIMTFSELRTRVEQRSEPRAYLYDCALPLKIPSLCERLGIPHYFAHDWLQRTRQLHAFSRSWPSLFVGSAGTRSSLHIDQWKGHFWMAQLQGCKRWTIFHPDDVWCLAPCWAPEAPRLEPTFPSLDEMEAAPELYPLLRHARRVDHVLRAGEVLLVPGGAPHRVVNGEYDDDPVPSVAIAGNFIDASNRDEAVRDLALMAARREGVTDPGAAATAAALAELDLHARDDLPDTAPLVRGRHAIPWAAYARGMGSEAAVEGCYWLETRHEVVSLAHATPRPDETEHDFVDDRSHVSDMPSDWGGSDRAWDSDDA
jgi:histone arginine demethylase JMJD6